jgi:phosphoribosylglycinamide formyltransferase 1
MARLRLGVLISGRGSNLQALIEAARDPAYPAEIALVVSNREDAAGLARAAAAGIPSTVVPHRDAREFAETTQRLLRNNGVGLVCLAGFMRVLDAGFVEAWRDRMINIHPSLLPMFKGLHAQRQALAAGVRFAGCTVHFVRPEIDAGPIIAQAVVPVHQGDDEERLSARILAVEHRLYPLVVRLVAEGRVHVEDGRVSIAGAQPPQIAALNPTDSGGECLVSPAG